MGNVSPYKTRVAIAIGLVLCALPWPAWILAGGLSFEGSGTENRTLAEPPVLGTTPLEELPAAVDAYLDDRLPLRDAMVQANSAIDYYALGTSSSTRVVAGKDGWLFYNAAAIDDGDPIGQYTGRRLFSEQELDLIEAGVRDLSDRCAERGIAFVLMICPNKERMCGEFMPDYYGERVPLGQLEQVIDRLINIPGLTLVCPAEALESYKAEHPGVPLYHQTDSHWNALGGYLAGRELLWTMGREDPFPLAASNPALTADNPGDLAGMLHLKDVMDGGLTCNPAYDGQAVRVSNDFGGHVSYLNEGGHGKLLVRRDSYFSAMLDYVAESFAEADFVHRQTFRFEFVDQEQPDIFVYELVERYLDHLVRLEQNEWVTGDLY